MIDLRHLSIYDKVTALVNVLKEHRGLTIIQLTNELRKHYVPCIDPRTVRRIVKAAEETGQVKTYDDFGEKYCVVLEVKKNE